ncbi:dicarboxylate/amino acid:cation symporter [Paenibacillus sp. TRM 82003]|uniref:dicarboxylate/amino acid:cation symporter n=1 Tax=Kineococcus sp. TRM81007 TaxID=2925831 RepID=UPI001F5A6CC1|nr:dicarboxylate/amino acid:cation symporter [Kineococcus sp. TRM81007]MCI2240267.1 dicarboxylate/amino acid:cation symporter [Kineococcus sp. TRM81007]MCI3927556.1 dicarboxylate/amino acid:cation symporter [Paenibacillus sp. TRM 82003]
MIRTLKRTPFGVQVLIGLVLGVVLGAIARSMGGTAEDPNWLTTTLSTIGSIFVTLLRTLVPPLVVLAVVTSIANLRQVTNAARLAWQTLLWFAITALISVGIGIALGIATDPGDRTSVAASAAQEPSRTGSWLDFLQGIVPGNVFGLQASASDDGVSLSFNVLQLLVISIALGVAILKVGEKAEPVLTVARSALAIVQTVLWWVIRLAPLGTVGLLGRAVASYGWDALSPLAVFVVDVYVGLALVLFVLYPVLLRANGLSVRRFFAGVWPATQLAFVSRSSIGTLPVTQRVTEEELGVPRSYASFAVPLGATTKMDGCAAIYPALSAIFVAGFFDVDLSITDYVLIAFVSVVGSAATAGLTGATVMLTLTLSTLGLPLAGVGLLLAIDPILDMGRTAVNVTGQALVPTIVAKREGILDLARFNSRRRVEEAIAEPAAV